MGETSQDKQQKKDAMNKLRKERKEWISTAAAEMKAHNKAVKAIKGELKKHSGTVPMIAEATGIPSDKVLWYIATLKKYGEIMEGEKDGNYFQYVLVGDPAEEHPNPDIS